MASAEKRPREDDSHDNNPSAYKKTARATSPDDLTFPDHRAYDEKTTDATEDTYRLLNELIAIVRPCAENSDTLRPLVDPLLEHSTLPLSNEKATLAIAGECGVGKSRSSNTLTRCATASKSLTVSASVTVIATLLVKRLSHQKRLGHAAEIRALDKKAFQSHMRELVEASHRYACGEDEDEPWSEDVERQYRRAAESAEELLAALCADKPEFSSQSAVRQAFAALSPGEIGDMVAMLMQQYSALLQRHGFQDINGVPTLLIDCDNAQALNQKLEPLIYKQSASTEPALWTILEVARKTIPDSGILEYMDILDLPGNSDSNIYLVMRSNRLIRKCTALWTLASLVQRPETNFALHSSVNEHIGWFEENLTIVVTKTDTGLDSVERPALVQELKKEKADLGRYHELGYTIADLRLRLENSFDDQIRTSLEQELAALELEQNDELVSKRNSIVTRQLQQKLGKTVNVICTSFTDWAEHQSAAKKKETRMSVEVTNVDRLTTEALRIAADTHYYRTHANVLRILDAMSGALLRATSTPSHRFQKSFKEFEKQLASQGIYSPRYASTSGPSSSAALQILTKHDAECKSRLTDLESRWSSEQADFRAKGIAAKNEQVEKWKHPQTVRAFFAKNGEREYRGEYVNLNEQIMKEQTNYVHDEWAPMRNDQVRTKRDAVGIVLKTLDVIRQEVSDYAASRGIDHTQCANKISSAMAIISNILERKERDFIERVKAIKNDTTGTELTSYFMQDMLSMYRAARAHKGDGAPDRMKKELDDCLHGRFLQNGSPKDPFETIRNLLFDDLTEASKQNGADLVDEIKPVVKNMMDAIHNFFLGDPKTAKEVEACGRIKEFFDREYTKNRLKIIRERFDIVDTTVEPAQPGFMQRLDVFLRG